MRKKIDEILQDMQFVLENHKTLYDEFGIDVMNNNNEISKYFAVTDRVNNQEIIPSTRKSSVDPDLF